MNTDWSHFGNNLKRAHDRKIDGMTNLEAMVCTSIRTWQERLVDAHHQAVIRRIELAGRDSVGRL